MEALSVSGALVALDTIPFKKKTSQLQIAWCKRIFVWDYIFTVVLISKVLNHEFWGAHPATGIKPAQDWKLKDFSFRMLPQFSMFNSNTKGIVLKCSKFHKLVSFDQHQIFQPPCPPGASSSSSMPLPLARSLVSSEVQGYTETTTMRSWEPRRSRFMNVLLKQFPSPRGDRKCTTKKYQNPY